MISFVIGLGVKFYRNRVQPLPDVEVTIEPDSSYTSVEISGEAEGTDQHDGEESLRCNLNSASRKDLQQIPGIGPVTADRIVRYREHNGNFKSIDDLENVKGIGSKTVKKISPFLIIE